MDSILDTIKKMIGLPIDDDSYDVDLIIHINSALSRLPQLNNQFNPLVIMDNTANWDQVFTKPEYEFIKTYIFINVRLVFDPPSNTTLAESLKAAITQYEWTLTVYDNNIFEEEVLT